MHFLVCIWVFTKNFYSFSAFNGYLLYFHEICQILSLEQLSLDVKFLGHSVADK